MIFEITAPNNKKRTFAIGVDFLSTLIRIPPEATNNELNKAMNARYSAKV